MSELIEDNWIVISALHSTYCNDMSCILWKTPPNNLSLGEIVLILYTACKYCLVTQYLLNLSRVYMKSKLTVSTIPEKTPGELGCGYKYWENRAWDRRASRCQRITRKCIRRMAVMGSPQTKLH